MQKKLVWFVSLFVLVVVLVITYLDGGLFWPGFAPLYSGFRKSSWSTISVVPNGQHRAGRIRDWNTDEDKLIHRLPAAGARPGQPGTGSHRYQSPAERERVFHR